jgi:signal transduction histidine kinase
MHSLHGRLFGTLLAILVCAWVVVGIAIYVQLAQERSSVADRALAEIARVILVSLPSDISHLSSGANLNLKSGAPAQLGKVGRRIQVWSKARHEMVLRSAGASSTPLKHDFTDGFSTVRLAGEEWRVYAISDARNEVQVQVGKPMSELGDELKSWLYYALGASLLALLVVGVAIKLVVRWSLKPVMTIQSTIKRRDALDLTPLPATGLPDEVRPLVDSFNRLLERLENAVQLERRFLTEAAHELRTPLAVMLAHAEVAQRARTLEEAQTALVHLARGVERSARLSQQLLDAARIERQGKGNSSVELAEIVAVVTHEFETMGAQKKQSIALDTEPSIIRGNVDDLGILVRNLLDNALRYTPRGGRIAVRCTCKVNVVRLEVLDDGPGVAEMERERIFDRFYRGVGNRERGSGIGLALVARIARSHDATVATGRGLDGHGFGISVSFPALEGSESGIAASARSGDPAPASL